MVPGQPAARGGAADTRAVPDQPAASPDRHWVVSDRAAVAAVHPDRHPDRGAGALRAAGLLPGGKIAVPAVGGGRSVARHVDVRWHDGVAAVAETVRLRGGVAEPARTARLRRHVAVAGRP